MHHRIFRLSKPAGQRVTVSSVQAAVEHMKLMFQAYGIAAWSVCDGIFAVGDTDFLVFLGRVLWTLIPVWSILVMTDWLIWDGDSQGRWFFSG